MSYKDRSAGVGKEPKPSSKLPAGERERGIMGERPSPWDSLRPVEPKLGEPKPPSRIGRFFRKALRWVTGLIVVFGLGVGTTWFVRVQPQNNQIDDLKNKLQAADITVGELESQLSTLMQMGVENENLSGQLSEVQLHVDMMRSLVDITSAELALAKDDLVTAKASLTGTDARLENLQEMFEGEDQQTIDGMRTRLSLVLEELETDASAAMSDLEVLASNLLALERSLFGN